MGGGHFESGSILWVDRFGKAEIDNESDICSIGPLHYFTLFVHVWKLLVAGEKEESGAFSSKGGRSSRSTKHHKADLP